jgi:hypothetical protein
MELTGGDHNNSDFRDLRANLPSSYQMYQNVETRSRMISSAIWEKKRCNRRRRHEVRRYRSGNGWGRDDSEYGDLRANLPSSYPYQRRGNSYDFPGYVGEKKDMKLGGMGNRVHRDGMYLIEQTPSSYQMYISTPIRGGGYNPDPSGSPPWGPGSAARLTGPSGRRYAASREGTGRTG